MRPMREGRLAHNYTLDQAALERSLTHLGDPRLLQPLFQRLQAGRPVTVGVLGASVAQNGGCTSQPGKRCMAFRGLKPLHRMWGERAPHKGFAVRLLELLNSTRARGGEPQPALLVLPCCPARPAARGGEANPSPPCCSLPSWKG